MKKMITHTIYSIGNDHASVAVVQPGELFTVKVTNAFGMSFEEISEFSDFMLNDKKKKEFGHPCTGPIEVSTTRDNISLAIEIVDIKITKGFQCISKSTGFLKEEFSDRGFKIFDFSTQENFQYHDDVNIKATPSIGFLATLDAQKRSPGRSCENGGNIDLNFLTKGSTIYLPVNDPCARIAVGDLHILQGNGEAAGIAIEADGEISLRIGVVEKMNFPVIENDKAVVVVGWGDSLESSLKQCTKNALLFLKRIFPLCDWTDIDLYKFISVEGNLVLGNSTGKVVTCGMMFHKDKVLNKYKFKILS